MANEETFNYLQAKEYYSIINSSKYLRCVAGDYYGTLNYSNKNDIGTCYIRTADGSNYDLSNSEYIKLFPMNGVSFSRVRLYNETDQYGVPTPDFNFMGTKVAKYTATIKVEDYNTGFTSNNVSVGFWQGHQGQNVPITVYTVSTGLLFRPNSLGNWRCSWFSLVNYTLHGSDNPAKGFREIVGFDTNIPITEKHKLEVIISDYNKLCQWLIDDVQVFAINVADYSNAGYTIDQSYYNELPPSVTHSPYISELLYTQDQNPETPSINSAYAGVELRQRVITGTTFSALIYNSNFTTTQQVN